MWSRLGGRLNNPDTCSLVFMVAGWNCEKPTSSQLSMLWCHRRAAVSGCKRSASRLHSTKCPEAARAKVSQATGSPRPVKFTPIVVVCCLPKTPLFIRDVRQRCKCGRTRLFSTWAKKPRICTCMFMHVA